MSLYLLGSSVVTLSSTNAFKSTPIESDLYTGLYGSIYVPNDLSNAYRTATNWEAYADRIVGV
jgi:hypothetical protein